MNLWSNPVPASVSVTSVVAASDGIGSPEDLPFDFVEVADAPMAWGDPGDWRRSDSPERAEAMGFDPSFLVDEVEEAQCTAEFSRFGRRPLQPNRAGNDSSATQDARMREP